MDDTKVIKIYSLGQESNSKSFFQLERLEDNYKRHAGKYDEAHRHDFYSILLITRGDGLHLVDFKEYKINDNNIFFLSPGQMHQLKFDTKPLGWAIHFSSDFLIINNIPTSFIQNINLFKVYGDATPLQIDSALKEKLNAIIKQILGLTGEIIEFQIEALGSCLKLFLIYCNNACNLPLPPDNPISCVLIDFKNAVENNYKKFHKVSDIANLLSITPKYLNQVVKQSIGCNAKEFILDRLILEAKRLLKHSQLTSKEIAYELGFNDPIQFSAFFKKHIGISPNSFKKEGIS